MSPGRSTNRIVDTVDHVPMNAVPNIARGYDFREEFLADAVAGF